METVALTSALPEGYRVDTGGEVRFVSPEEVLAGLAAPEWEGLRGEEGAETALGVWCVLAHSRLLGEMADFTAEAGEEGLLEQAWLTLPGWEEADDPDLLEAVSGYSRYFLSADGTLIRAEASMAEILAAFAGGRDPGGPLRPVRRGRGRPRNGGGKIDGGRPLNLPPSMALYRVVLTYPLDSADVLTVWGASWTSASPTRCSLTDSTVIWRGPASRANWLLSSGICPRMPKM